MRRRINFLAILASSCLISSMGYSLPPTFQHPAAAPPTVKAKAVKAPVEEEHGLAKSKQARIDAEEVKK